MDSVYISPLTPYCAALSAGGAIEACRAVMLGKVKNVFAVIRPPGHHAEREDAKGFCFYDNVSIATKVCQREFGERCRKVFILDWDVHHGNGIQQANYDDPNVSTPMGGMVPFDLGRPLHAMWPVLRHTLILLSIALGIVHIFACSPERHILPGEILPR